MKNSTGLENGTVQHHVSKADELERKKGAIVHSERCGCCPMKKFCRDECIVKLLENDVRKKAVKRKLGGQKSSVIAEELGVDKSTVSYHLSLVPHSEQGFDEAFNKLAVF